jgi:hypothetical protein
MQTATAERERLLRLRRALLRVSATMQQQVTAIIEQYIDELERKEAQAEHVAR